MSSPQRSPSPLDLFDLSGKVAVVTGGSRGLGRQMALAFAHLGADVVIASRKLEECRKVAAEVEVLGRRALPVACHVGYWEQCDQLIDTVHDHFGHLDVLVNNAGMSPLYPSLVDVGESLFDKVLDVNLKGPFRLMAYGGHRMREAGGGVIINVSSTASVKPTPTEAAYSAAKSGINALTVAFAHEYGPEVRVNCIMAGPFLTDISKAWDMVEFTERVQNNFALQRGGEPEEVVGAAIYFASAASTFCSGAVLRLDGGGS
jgi:NAD(P)-dependent dehydrogenase (short-subunit alcohol dehydrogenase family)